VSMSVALKSRRGLTGRPRRWSGWCGWPCIAISVINVDLNGKFVVRAGLRSLILMSSATLSHLHVREYSVVMCGWVEQSLFVDMEIEGNSWEDRSTKILQFLISLVSKSMVNIFLCWCRIKLTANLNS
jgi:hypothetical protein